MTLLQVPCKAAAQHFAQFLECWVHRIRSCWLVDGPLPLLSSLGQFWFTVTFKRSHLWCPILILRSCLCSHQIQCRTYQKTWDYSAVSADLVWFEISMVKQQLTLMSLPVYVNNEQQQREQNEWIDERQLHHFILWLSTAVSKKEASFTFSSYINDYSGVWEAHLKSEFTELMVPAEAGLGAPPPGAHSFWVHTDHPTKPGFFSLLIRTIVGHDSSGDKVSNIVYPSETS